MGCNVKVGVLKKKSAALDFTAEVCASGRGSDSFESFSKFDRRQFCSLWPTDPILPTLKDLTPSQSMSKVQEACSTFRICFIHSERHHFHKAYLVTGYLCKEGVMAVVLNICTYMDKNYKFFCIFVAWLCDLVKLKRFFVSIHVVLHSLHILQMVKYPHTNL